VCVQESFLSPELEARGLMREGGGIMQKKNSERDEEGY